MKERYCLHTSRDYYPLGSVPRTDRLCEQCGELDVEEHVMLVVAGEEFPLQLCTPCADKVLGREPEDALTDLVERECEYAPICVLDRCERRPVDYRISELLTI